MDDVEKMVGTETVFHSAEGAPQLIEKYRHWREVQGKLRENFLGLRDLILAQRIVKDKPFY